MNSLSTLKTIIKDLENSKFEFLINRSYGGFALSKKACLYLGLEYGKDEFNYTYSGRTDEKLISCFKELGNDFSYDNVKLIEIDFDDILTSHIQEYDGMESLEYSPNDFTTPILKLI